MEVQRRLLSGKGGLQRCPPNVAHTIPDPVIAHFLYCSDEEALDVIELCFRTDPMGGDSTDSHTLVAALNSIFEEEGLGYELTQPTTVDTGEKAYLFGQETGSNAVRTEFPRIIRKDECTIHEKAVKPALEALRDPRLATANTELLNAFQKIREGDYADAITSCAAAFESVLKTICDVKGWGYDPDKDTCSTLIEICRKQGLFSPYYTETFKGVGTIRNKVGDAHGKGPKPAYAAERAHAEHMIAITCAHIHFLGCRAGLY
jgi:hypothetical protein